MGQPKCENDLSRYVKGLRTYLSCKLKTLTWSGFIDAEGRHNTPGYEKENLRHCKPEARVSAYTLPFSKPQFPQVTGEQITNAHAMDYLTKRIERLKETVLVKQIANVVELKQTKSPSL